MSARRAPGAPRAGWYEGRAAAAALITLALLLPYLGNAASDGAVPPLEPVAAYATRRELVDPTLSPDGQVLA